MIVNLTRDEARAVETRFFPYLENLLITKVNDAKQFPFTGRKEDPIYLSVRIVQCCFLELKKIIARRLLSDAKKFKLKITNAQGITFYKLLLILPLDPAEVWLHTLRQQIITQLDPQL